MVLIIRKTGAGGWSTTELHNIECAVNYCVCATVFVDVLLFVYMYMYVCVLTVCMYSVRAYVDIHTIFLCIQLSLLFFTAHRCQVVRS